MPRHSLENIEETHVFTLNHIKPNFIEQSHQTSARYDKTISEFDVVGLSPYFTDALMAPYVKESDIRIGLKYVEKNTAQKQQYGIGCRRNNRVNVA